jgi:uncharacterized protein (TIGR03083 family)
MASANPWPTIHGEREALLGDLEPLSDEQWNTPSMCGGWSVQQVLGHIIATAKMTPPKFMGGMISSGFRFNSMVAKDVAREAGGTGPETLSRFKAVLGNTTHPPGPIDAMVGEAIIHSEDIRRPLGIKREYPTDACRVVADFYKGSNLIVGAKKRITGVKLSATDTDWTNGDGPEASGPILAIVLAMTGRPSGLDDLSGEGVATLKARG